MRPSKRAERKRRRRREAAGFSEACRGNNVRQETGRCYPALQPDRIAFDITPRPWVIVAEIIVTQFCALVEELPRKAELVAEGARWVAITEGVMVPQPHDRAARVGDLMRAPKMIRREIELRARRKHSGRQIAEPGLSFSPPAIIIMHHPHNSRAGG